jgi:hypothetical protein
MKNYSPSSTDLPEAENHKRSITKARNGESTKKNQGIFRVFSALGGCFRDNKIFS